MIKKTTSFCIVFVLRDPGWPMFYSTLFVDSTPHLPRSSSPHLSVILFHWNISVSTTTQAPLFKLFQKSKLDHEEDQHKKWFIPKSGLHLTWAKAGWEMVHGHELGHYLMGLAFQLKEGTIQVLWGCLTVGRSVWPNLESQKGHLQRKSNCPSDLPGREESINYRKSGLIKSVMLLSASQMLSLDTSRKEMCGSHSSEHFLLSHSLIIVF